jgi:hypothetical protein
MVPSSCSTRTKLPDASLPRPLCSFSIFTTTPLRAAMIGVPSGMAMSMARLFGVRVAEAAVGALGQANGPPRQGKG